MGQRHLRQRAPSWNQFDLNIPFESSRLRLSNAFFKKPFFKKPTDSLCVANDGCPRLRILKMKIMVRPLAPSWNQFNLNTPFESSRLRLSNALLLSHALALPSPALAPSSRHYYYLLLSTITHSSSDQPIFLQHCT